MYSSIVASPYTHQDTTSITRIRCPSILGSAAANARGHHDVLRHHGFHPAIVAASVRRVNSPALHCGTFAGRSGRGAGPPPTPPGNHRSPRQGFVIAPGTDGRSSDPGILDNTYIRYPGRCLTCVPHDDTVDARRFAMALMTTLGILAPLALVAVAAIVGDGCPECLGRNPVQARVRAPKGT